MALLVSALLARLLARLDRACDVTGAAIGMVVGTGLALLMRPWRR